MNVAALLIVLGLSLPQEPPAVPTVALQQLPSIEACQNVAALIQARGGERIRAFCAPMTR